MAKKNDQQKFKLKKKNLSLNPQAQTLSFYYFVLVVNGNDVRFVDHLKIHFSVFSVVFVKENDVTTCRSFEKTFFSFFFCCFS